MTIRARLSDVLLVLAIVGIAINVGGTFFQMQVLIPEWSRDLPESVGTFFADGRWFAAQNRFWSHPVTTLSVLMVLIALPVSWPYRERRNWTLVALVLLVPILLSTALWFVPQGVMPLMRDAGAGMSPAEITSLAERWIFWDRVRFVGALVVLVAALRALVAPPMRASL